MAAKFGRNYRLVVTEYLTGKSQAVSPPFTLRFNITRYDTSTPSGGTLQIYNLNQDSRTFFRKDINTYGRTKGVLLLGGYGEKLSTMFLGDIYNAFSERVGQDWVTTINGFDGGIAYNESTLSTEIVRGIPLRSVLRSMAKSLSAYEVEVGAISKTYTQKNTRGNSYSGSTFSIMTELTGGGMFVDNGKVNCLRDNEFIVGDVVKVNASTGLLGTPKREGSLVTFSTILEPRFYIAQKIEIEIGNQAFDGTYKVKSINHAGTISDAVGETCTTTVTCEEFKSGVGVVSG